MRLIKLFLASLVLGVSLTLGGFAGNNAIVQAHSGHTPAQCTSLTGGPNSAYSTELEWDFALGMNLNGANRSTMQYRYIAIDTSSNTSVFDNTTSNSSRRIKFPKAGSYKVSATATESGQHQSTCSTTIKIGAAAVCTGIAGGPNGAQPGVLEWDFALNTTQNDSKTSDLKYRYEVLEGNKQIYDSLSTSVSRRITFPKAGTYTVIGSIAIGSHKSECRRTVTIASSTSSPAPTPPTPVAITPAPPTPGTTTPQPQPTPTPIAKNTNQSAPKPTATPVKALPNTGPADVFTAFSATSAIGYAASLLRRRFF